MKMDFSAQWPPTDSPHFFISQKNNLVEKKAPCCETINKQLE